MSYLSPITIGDIQYVDIRNMDQDFEFASGRESYEEAFEAQMDIALASTGLEAGCASTSRNRISFEAWRLHKRMGGTLTYEQFLRQLEATRVCEDRINDDAVLLLGFKGARKTPVGGCGFYNIEMLGPVSRSDPTMTYRAMCVPLAKNDTDTADFMRRLLDAPTPGFNDAGDPQDFQLVEWTFPTRDVRNRWLVSIPHISQFISNIGPHLLTTALQDGGGGGGGGKQKPLKGGSYF